MWYAAFGWKENPFSIKTNTRLFGLDSKKTELINYILSSDICFLNGPTGVGKSSLMKLIEKELKNHKVIYLDAAEVEEGFSITKYLQKSNNIWNKLAGKKFPDNVVILLDESQECDTELVKALKLHWDHDNIKSIVITQINPNLDGFSESFKSRIGNRIVKIDRIPKSDAFNLLDFRTKNKNPFENPAVEAIIEYSDYNPRKILETCEIICAKLYKKKTKNINVSDVKNILKQFDNKVAKDLNSNEIEKKNKTAEVRTETNLKLSPMERKILDGLKSEDKTAQQLAEALSTTEGSVGKQLSKLMKKKMIKITDPERPKKYGIINQNTL